MSSKKRILVIEDDNSIRRAVSDALSFAGYEVQQTGKPDEGLRLAMMSDCDLLLLDLVLPRADGRTILKTLRNSGSSLPVIILTACGFESERIAGLQAGADDYVVKPFSVQELLARVQAVLRRSPSRPSPIAKIQREHGEINLDSQEIRKSGGERIPLSQRETELLAYLAKNSSRVVSREEILRFVWKLEPTGVQTRTIDMHIARLRDKLSEAIGEPDLLLTVRGKGYRLNV